MELNYYDTVKDFNLFLDYFATNSPKKLTKKKALLTADLLVLNEQMAFKSKFVTNKTVQIKFSLLNCFFYIAKEAKLITIKENEAKSSYFAVLNSKRLAIYGNLTPEEKYFSIFEAFWRYMPWQEAFDYRREADDIFIDKLLQFPANQPIPINHRNPENDTIIRSTSMVFAIDFFAELGFLELIYDENVTDTSNLYDNFPYKTVTLTEWGKAALTLLITKRPFEIWSLPFSGFDITKNKGLGQGYDPEATMGNFEEVFLKILPDWRIENRLMPILVPKISGAYVFKIDYNSIVDCTVKIDGKAKLSSLYTSIKEAFNLEDIRHYGFCMDGIPWSQNQAKTHWSPYADADGIPATKINIENVGLEKDDSFIFLYSSRKDLILTITLTDILTEEAPPKKGTIIAKTGSLPISAYE